MVQERLLNFSGANLVFAAIINVYLITIYHFWLILTNIKASNLLQLLKTKITEQFYLKLIENTPSEQVLFFNADNFSLAEVLNACQQFY